MSSSASSSSSSTLPWKHDVFLSFYGEDTRKAFTDHLYAALKKKGIFAFRDDEKLKRGEFFAPGLVKAIEESKHAVVVLSPNYASSRWCLIELAKIVESMKKTGLTVLPVFYGVDPADVRKQAGTFAKAFLKHEQDPRITKEDLQTWKAAMQDVGYISGWPLDANRYESTVVDEIVATVNRGVGNSQLSSVDSKDHVGIELRAKKVMDLLDIELDEVRFIGISGLGGVGKTTLAKLICDRVSHKFEAYSFISNVRDDTQRYGLVHLQRKLLSNVLTMESEIIQHVWNDHTVAKNMRSRLRGTKVLIILDDVNEASQLEELAGDHEWFGRGSRVIVTGRDKQLLTSNKVQAIYTESGLDFDEALQLFSRKALGKSYPEQDYLSLSIDFVNYADGLPLALRVLGSSLKSKPTHIWKSARDQLKSNPERRIFDILEIGFENLGDMEKNLFLDIACFFRGEDTNGIKDILKGLGYLPDCEKNIDVLVDTSLISVVGRKLWMHDLLQEMGRNIVRREFPEDPGKRSRLWLWEDAISVLQNPEGPAAVKGIVLKYLPPQKEEHLDAKAFSTMKKLRLLKISNVFFPQGLNYLSNELRLIDWQEYPLKSLPTSFKLVNLVKLSMHCSHIRHLWEGTMNANNLKHIDLSDSKDLIKTPDFTGAPNLETLILQGCTSLNWVHPSIGLLKQLVVLNLKGCTCLQNLPDNISLDSLQILDLSGCSRVRKFPEIVGNMERLSELYLDGICIKELPSSFGSLGGLIVLSLRDCKFLSVLPSVILGSSSLKTLILSGCSSFGDNRPQNLTMECLALFCCPFLLRGIRMDSISLLLPDSFSGLNSLISLDLSDCNLLDGAIPSDLRGFSSLQSLNLSGNKLTRIPDSILHLSSLISLNLSACNLTDGAISSDLRHLSSLQYLNLSRNELTSIPDSICQLSKLVELDLRDCRMLRSLPRLPSSVLYVWKQGCVSLETYSDKTEVWTSNETITVVGRCSTSAEHEDKRIHRIPLSDAQIPLLAGRNQLEAEINHRNVFCISSSLQATIPEWFTIQTGTGSSATLLPLHLELDNNSKWVGYAMFVVYEVREHENLNSRPSSDSEDGHQFVCHFETDSLNQTLAFRVPIVPSVKLIGMWIYIPYSWFSEWSNNLDKWSFIEGSVTSGSPGVNVKKFGVRLLNEHDALEFVEDVRWRSLGGLYHVNHSSYYKIGNYILDLPKSVDDIECSSNHSNCNGIPCPVSFGRDKGAKFDSIIQLKEDLEKLLTKCFEVKYARKKIYKYILPRSTSQLLPWFRAHGFRSPQAGTHLPSNLYDDESWIGFALYACFPLQKPPTVSGDNPCSRFSFNFFCYLGTNDDCLQPLVIFPVTEDKFVESHRLVLFHVPREFFNQKLNQQKDIKATFGSYDRSVIKVQHCGIRIIYERDLEGFIETIVDHMLRSPDVHHQGYHQRLFDEVEVLQSSVHHDDVESSEPLEVEMPSDFYQSTSLQRRLQSQQKHSSSIQPIPRQNRSSLGTYSGQVSARGASRDSTFNVTQDFFDNEAQTYRNCFLEDEVPEWFLSRNGSSMMIQLPFDFCENSNWKGVALCAAFEILKHPNLVHDDVGTKISYEMTCFVGRDINWSIAIPQTITETEINKYIGLNQRKFIWIVYIPRALILGEQKKCNLTLCIKFTTDCQHLNVRKCGCRGVHHNNVAELVRMITQCSTASPYNSHQFVAADEGPNTGTGSSDERLALKCINFMRKRSKDFESFDIYEYDNCFPPSEILEFFSSSNSGPTVTIELLDKDLNWTGIALYALFSVPDYPTEVLDNPEAKIPHHLICHFETEVDSLNSLRIYRTTREEFKWSSSLGGFIWLSYIPHRCLPSGINRCNRIKASIVSDCQRVTVKNCGLRLVQKPQDGRAIWQIMFQCAVSFVDNWDIFRRDVAQHDCTREDNLGSIDHSGSSTSIRPDDQGSKSDSTAVHDKDQNLEGFDSYSDFDIMLPQLEIPTWFCNQSRGSSVAIQLPSDLYNDNEWRGVVLCASFSVNEHQTSNHGNLDSDVPHNLMFLLKPNTVDSQLSLSFKADITLKEKGMPLYVRGSVWIYYIPRESLPNGLSFCSGMEALFQSDWPELKVHSCGLRLYYHQDVQQFEQTIKECAASGFYNNIDLFSQLHEENDASNDKQNNVAGEAYKDIPYPERLGRPIYQLGESSGSLQDRQYPENKLPMCGPLVFDRGVVHNFCFPRSEILEHWFSHHNNMPFVADKIPRGSHNNTKWIGLVLCASFAAHDQRPTVIRDASFCLICHLETDIPCVHPAHDLHVYCLNEEDLTLLHLGGFIWLSYIPRGSLPDWSSQCNRIKASFLNDCQGLTVEKCGLRFLYEREEEEFEQMIRHCMSDNLDRIEGRKQNGHFDLPMLKLKDKGKRVLE